MLIKKISKITAYLGLVTSCLFYGCKDKLELPNQPIDVYTQVYLPAAYNTVVTTLKITDSVQTAIYGADFGGYKYPTADIPVTFKVNPAMVDSFNIVNKTNYTLLPEGSYSLETNSATIPKGQLSTQPLKISFKTKGDGAMDGFKTYILPVTLASASIKINQSLKTAYYQVLAQPDFKDYPDYDRAKWQIIAFSSQEANGEGANNGRAIFAIDGDINTYWHTQWQGASPGPPHYLVIDMGEVKAMHGVSFVGRQGDGGGKPNDVDVQISLDNVTWTDAGAFNLLNNKDLQKQFLPLTFGKDARYFKIIINSAYNGGYTQVAELNAF